MSRIHLLSCGNDGTSNPILLDSLGVVEQLHLITGRNGSRSATWTFDRDAAFEHPGLNVNNWIYALNGLGVCWSGRLREPGRGTPWQCSADGIAAEATKWLAYDPNGNALNVGQCVDQAAGRGLRWVRSGSLGTITAAVMASGTATLDEALSTVANNTGQSWYVTDATPSTVGTVTMTTPPTAASYLLIASDDAGGRTAQDFVSTVIVSYLDSTTRALTQLVIANTTVRARTGTVEAPLDLTDHSYISAATATSQANAYLASMHPRSKYTGTFTVANGQLLTTGGQAVDIATVPASVLVRVMQVIPDAANEIDLATPTELLLDEIDYDVDADVAMVTPLDAVSS